MFVDLATYHPGRGDALAVLGQDVGGDDPGKCREAPLPATVVDRLEFGGGLGRDDEGVDRGIGRGDAQFVLEFTDLEVPPPLVECVERRGDASFALLERGNRTWLVTGLDGEVVTRQRHDDAVLAEPEGVFEQQAVSVVDRTEGAGDGDAHTLPSGAEPRKLLPARSVGPTVAGSATVEKPYDGGSECRAMDDPTDRETLRGAAMTDAEIDAFLTDEGTGVLALADGGDAYAIPISFGYDGERVVFSYWQFGPESRKREYTESTQTACLAVYDVASTLEWQSVLAFGDLAEIPPERWDDLGQLLEDNAWSPDVSTVGNRQLSIVGYELVLEEVTGLQGPGCD